MGGGGLSNTSSHKLRSNSPEQAHRPRGGAEFSRAEGNPYPKLKSPRIGPHFFREGSKFTKNEMRDKMSEF